MSFPDASLSTLDHAGLEHFRALRLLAVDSVVTAQQPAGSESSSPGHRWTTEQLRSDLILHLEALEPVLEFGVLHPMIDHLGWVARVHRARTDTVALVSNAVELLADFFLASMGPPRGAVVADALRAAHAVALSSMVAARLPVAPERWPETDAFTTALRSGSTPDALDLMNRHLDANGDLAEFETQVIQPALYDIGQLWEANKVTVADEHVATAIARCVMTVGALRACSTHPTGPRIALACAEGNRHEIGLQMVADAFRLAGWQVLFLGADVPASETVQCAVDWRADVLGVSVAFAHQMRSVGDITDQLGAFNDDRRIPVIVGGIAAVRYPWLAHAKGAGAVAGHCRDSIPVAARLARGNSP